MFSFLNLYVAVSLFLQVPAVDRNNEMTSGAAYELGVRAFRESTPEGYERARDMFQTALERDLRNCEYAVRLAEANLFLALEQASDRRDFSKSAAAGRTPACALNTPAASRLDAVRSLQDVELGVASIGSTKASQTALESNKHDALNWYIDWRVKPQSESQILKAIELDPTLPMIQYEVGQYWLSLSEFAKARAAFQRALDFNDRHFRSYLGLAQALMHLEPTQDVEHLYLKVLDLAPGLFQGHMMLGDYYLYLAEHELADEQYQIAAEIRPQLQVPLLKAAFNSIESRNMDDAERAALNVLLISPGSEEALFYLGRVAQYRRESDLAQRRYEQALKLAPRFADAAYALSEILFENRQYRRALDLLDGILADNAKYTRAYHLRALVFWNIQKLSEALADLQRAEELYVNQIVELDKTIKIATQGRFERRRQQQTKRREDIRRLLETVQSLSMSAEAALADR